METVSRVIDGFEFTVDKCDEDLLFGYPWHRLRNKRSNNYGYAYWSYADKQKGGTSHIFLHRLIINRMVDHQDFERVDHKDLDTTNNRRSNLRIADRYQNGINREIFHNNTSGYKGVHFSNGCYHARIIFQGDRKYLGAFTTALEAGYAYNKAALHYFGSYAWLNPITAEEADWCELQLQIREASKPKYRGITQIRNGNFQAAVYLKDEAGKRKRIHVGTFTEKETAARAYNLAAIYYFGSEAQLNLVEM